MSDNTFNIYELPGAQVMTMVTGKPYEIMAMLAGALENKDIHVLVLGALLIHAHREGLDVVKMILDGAEDLKNSL